LRTSSHQAAVLWPPRITGEQEWKLMASAACEAQHSADEIVDTLAKRGLGFDVALELTPQDIAGAMMRRMARSAP